MRDTQSIIHMVNKKKQSIKDFFLFFLKVKGIVLVKQFYVDQALLCGSII